MAVRGSLFFLVCAICVRPDCSRYVQSASRCCRYVQSAPRLLQVRAVCVQIAAGTCYLRPDFCRYVQSASRLLCHKDSNFKRRP